MACNAPTCSYPDWTFADFTVTPIWRACRYRKFPQRSGMHPKQPRLGSNVPSRDARQPSCDNVDLPARRKAGSLYWYTKYGIQELT
jgi:hypothetical protein